MSKYLYCDEFCLTLLKERKLPFRTVDSLSDPFIYCARVFDDGAAHDVSEAEYDAELQSQYAALPTSVAGLITFDYFKQQAAARRHRIEDEIKGRRRPRGITIGPEKQGTFVIFSAYERADNPLLWQKFGHGGVAIEVDDQHPWFVDKTFEGKPQRYAPVNYQYDRPLVSDPRNFMAALFTRPEAFAAEQEHRLLRPTSVVNKTVMHKEAMYQLIKVPVAVIQRVILGVQSSDAFSKKIQTLLQTDIRLRHIELAKMVVDPYCFRLHVESL